MYNTLIKSLVLGAQNRYQNWKFASAMALRKKNYKSFFHIISNFYRLSSALFSFHN